MTRNPLPATPIALPGVLLLGILMAAATALQTPHSGRAAFPGANGDIVFYSERVAPTDQIFRINSSGGAAVQLTSTGRNYSPAVSPDGTQIAFISTRDGVGAEIYVMNQDGTLQTRLTTNTDSESSPAWSADGSTIAFLRRNEAGDDIKIWTVDASGSGSPVVLIDSAGTDTMPAFSPDGSKIAYGHNDPGETDLEIYVANADGSNPIRLTDNDTPDFVPDWSPDSNRLVYQCRFSGTNNEICAMDADGGNQQSLTPGSVYYFDPVWSPDGTRIAFNDFVDPSAIYTMNTSGGDIQLVSALNDYEPDWQPLSAPTSTATPTATGTATPTATPTPTPTSPAPWSPGPLTQGDVDCNGSVSSVDALKELRHVADLSVSQKEPCPDIGEDVASVWGDVDCNEAVTAVDALKILRHVASLPVSQTEPCPDIGTPGGG